MAWSPGSVGVVCLQVFPLMAPSWSWIRSPVLLWSLGFLCCHLGHLSKEQPSCYTSAEQVLPSFYVLSLSTSLWLCSQVTSLQQTFGGALSQQKATLAAPLGTAFMYLKDPLPPLAAPLCPPGRGRRGVSLTCRAGRPSF